MTPEAQAWLTELSPNDIHDTPPIGVHFGDFGPVCVWCAQQLELSGERGPFTKDGTLGFDDSFDCAECRMGVWREDDEDDVPSYALHLRPPAELRAESNTDTYDPHADGWVDSHGKP